MDDTADMTLGQLYQAAMNLDILLTAAQGRLSPGDSAYMQQQAARIDDELKRRGHRTYGEL